MNKKINHPNHYQHPTGVEAIDVIEYFNFNVGNAMKYLWRAVSKPDESIEDDLQKAIWYIERELMRIKNDNKYINAINSRLFIPNIKHIIRADT